MAETSFSGSVPDHYDDGLGPVIFEPYAVELAQRVGELGGAEWLEVAAGTGRLTRHLAATIPPDGRIVATDLQEGMLDVARRVVSDRRVRFEAADATALPYEDGEFDGVVSQFGVMFYPDRLAGHREARRVLRPGGTYLIASWGTQGENAWAGTIQRFIERSFPQDPPGFFQVPFSYADPVEIESELRQGGFGEVQVEQVALPLVAPNACQFARGAVQGTPVVAEIAARGEDAERAVERLTAQFREQFGDWPMQSEMIAYVTTAR